MSPYLFPRVACPSCGDHIELTLTLGSTGRREDGSVQVPVSFDEQDFEQRFSARVLADPLVHPQFVTLGAGGETGN